MRDEIFPYLSYITNTGDEIVLSCEGFYKWWECYGRKGFVAPSLKTEEAKFADGSSKIMAIRIKPRTLVVEMVTLGRTSSERDLILRNIASGLTQIGSNLEIGKLKITRLDGKTVYIDCAYIGGMDDIQAKYPRFQRYSLRFYSTNGYFYDQESTKYNINIFQSEGLLNFGNDFIFSDSTFFRSNGLFHDRTVYLDGYRAYPVITIKGPANNIALINQSIDRMIAFDPKFYLLSGESLTIQTASAERGSTVKRIDGTEEDGFRYLLPETNLDWYLTAGKNEISYRNSNNNRTTNCELAYQQMWLSA